MITTGTTTTVEWVTALSAERIRAHRALFTRIYPDFIPDVTARYDHVEQVAVTTGADGVLLSWAGSRRRHISVGDTDLVISGAGGVMTNPDARRSGAARTTLTALTATFASGGRCESDFGFLQCRSEIVPFYTAVGWKQVSNPVTHIDDHDGATPVVSTGPTLIVPGRLPVTDWPDGMVDLRGLPW